MAVKATETTGGGLMPLYRPPGPPQGVVSAVPAPEPPVRSESSTPPIAEMVKAGVRCESDLVIEPAVLQESTTGQQFVTRARVATVDGVKEVDALLADSGHGSRNLGVVVRSARDRAIASVVTEQPRSESDVGTAGREEGTSTTPAKDPGVSQYEGDYQPIPSEDLAAINAAIRARNQGNFEVTLSSQTGSFEVTPGDFAGSGQPPSGNYDPYFVPSHIEAPPNPNFLSSHVLPPPPPDYNTIPTEFTGGGFGF